MVSIDAIRSLLTAWCDSQQELYAVFFEPAGMQAITGRVTGVDESSATLTDSVVQLRLRLDEDVDAFFTHREDGRVISITMTWPNGTSAFVVVR